MPTHFLSACGAISAGTVARLLLAYRYWLLLPLALVEGPVVALVAGALVALGYLQALPVFLIAVLGDFLPDMTCFAFGRWGRRTALLRRWGGRAGAGGARRDRIRTDKTRMDEIWNLWHTRPLQAMLLSKGAYGLSPALLTTAGLAGLPATRFAGWALLIAALQDGALLLIGYEYASSVWELAADLRTLSLLIGGGTVLFCTGALLFARRARSAWGNEP